jgi:hypothetical protein
MYGDQAPSLEEAALNAFEFYRPAKASPAPVCVYFWGKRVYSKIVLFAEMQTGLLPSLDEQRWHGFGLVGSCLERGWDRWRLCAGTSQPAHAR